QSVMPTGSVVAFAGSDTEQVLPLYAQGFLVCDGRTLLVSEFYELFLAIRYHYSPSANGPTFRVPDLRGYFLRGVDLAGTIDPDTKSRTLPDGTTGAAVGSVQQSAFQLHEHEYMPATPAGATVAGDAGTVGTGTTTTSAVVQGN